MNVINILNLGLCGISSTGNHSGCQMAKAVAVRAREESVFGRHGRTTWKATQQPGETD